jgi:hypothetical protein
MNWEPSARQRGGNARRAPILDIIRKNAVHASQGGGRFTGMPRTTLRLRYLTWKLRTPKGLMRPEQGQEMPWRKPRQNFGGWRSQSERIRTRRLTSNWHRVIDQAATKSAECCPERCPEEVSGSLLTFSLSSKYLISMVSAMGLEPMTS